MTSSRSSPSSYIVYPVHPLDNAQEYRNLFMSYIFRFNDVLDSRKLADALSTLLETGDWAKLGGRFRFNDDGNLEIHVEQQATPDSPRFAYSQQQVDASIDDASDLGNRLPILVNQCAVQQVSSELSTFSGAPNAPKSIEEMMRRDAPLLSLYITHFTDGTVVAVSWPHPLMDAVGLQALMRNWSLILSDRPEQVQPLAGTQTDILQEILDNSNSPKEPLLIEKISVGVLGMVALLFRFIWLMLWKPGFEKRAIILPQHAIDQLCSVARDDIATQGNTKAFVSEGDVLAAWAAQMLALSQPKPRPITVAPFINLRFRLTALQESGSAFIQNLLQFAYVSFAPCCTSATLGSMAVSYRQQLMEQSTLPQILSYLRMQFDHVKKNGKLRLVFGDPRAVTLTVNNLCKIDFFHTIDFSGAVVSSNRTHVATEKSMNPPGTIVYYHALVLNEPSVLTSHLQILGKDHSGRILMTGTFDRRTWDRVVKQLDLLL